MIFLIDAQISPAIAAWINRTYPDHSASSLASHNLRHATDSQVFAKAVELDAVLVTKNSDFIQRVEQTQNPPRVMWVRVGNSSNAHMQQVLRRNMESVITLFDAGEIIVEVSPL